MPKFNKAQVLAIRNNAERLLNKMKADEKNDWKRLAYKYEALKTSTDKIISLLKNSKTEEKMAVLLKQVKQDLGETIKVTRPDFTPLSQAIIQLQKVVTESLSDKRPNSNTIALISILNSIKKELGKSKQMVDRTDELVKAIKNIKLKSSKTEFPETMAISNFPIQKIANPATHISINSLKGFVHTTSTTVTTSLTKLPGYGVLANRRSLLIYNNSTSDLYIGGSNVTTINGMIIPQKSYSPSLDAGKDMIVYGVTASGSINIRCLEISDISSGR